jgi:RimJ/RimL family protein N-acetyltransferase
MSSWVPDPTTLTGKTVDLLPLNPGFFPVLSSIAINKKIWQFFPVDGSKPETFANLLTAAMDAKAIGTQYPFVIFHKTQNKIIGSTRLMDIQKQHRKLEIGSTWLIPEFWGTSVNLECKLLLLTFCFEKLGTSRVFLKTDENNIRSRKAILKIGADFEGILRNDMIRENNTKRNSAYYSFIEEEWKTKKARLKSLLEKQKS